MLLGSDNRLSHCEILDPPGTKTFGEVWRASAR